MLYLVRVLLGPTATATSFPLSKHTGGGDSAPAFLGLRVCLQLTWEVGLPPLFCGVFLPPLLLQAFLFLVFGQVLRLLPSPASLFIYSSVRDSPPSVLRVPHLFALCLFCCYCLLLRFFFLFFLGGVRSVQGVPRTA
jgi:hypothetical protein